ncbi:MAG: RNA polymerase subunit sigma, partial [Spirochaetia bacterium]|nr:RNA polymerase subunit sigma [Spirochaetia bacterium]
MDELILKAAEAVKKSKNMIALTGAGVSVESGIPDFRSAGGLWEKYDPAIYASIDTFRLQPERCWDMIFDMLDLTDSAKPNPAHTALAELEEMGYLKAIITQNIDNLHQRGGSKNVIEYHGNSIRLVCLKCKSECSMDEYDKSGRVPPKCKEC